jgi:opacity protein-like surface antigen
VGATGARSGSAAEGGISERRKRRRRRDLTPDSSQFNFTIDYGAGIQVFTSPRRAITIDYRYYHISNADIAINPGTDANVYHGRGRWTVNLH